MLDAFLEVVAERTKRASADARREELLAKLPLTDLLKVASGEALPKEGSGDGCSWLDKFRGTPLLDEAIVIEKAELDLQMRENEIRQAERELREQSGGFDGMWAERDNLAIRRRLLDLELVGADVSSPEDAELEEGGEEPMDAPAATPAAAAPAEVTAPAVEEPAAAPPPKSKAPPVPPAAAGGQEGEDVGAPPAEEDAGPPPPKAEGKDGPPPAKAEGEESGEEKPKPKPPTTKVTRETVEKPAEEKIDVKAAAARLRFALGVNRIKEAQPANRAGSFRR